MKKLLTAALMLTTCFLCGISAAAAEEVVVYYTSDIHSYIDNHLDEDEPGLSYSKVAALKNSTENALLQYRLQKQLAEKPEHRLGNGIILQSIAVIDKAAVQTRGVVIAYTAHQRAHGSTVQIVQPQGDVPQVGAALAATQQHGRQQRVQRCLVTPHRP